MKSKTIIQIVLGVVIIGLAAWLYMSMMEPIKFDNEYTKRRDACAEKLKAIRTLEEAYKTTYGCYTGSFDTLFTRLMNEDSMRVVAKTKNFDKIPEDVEVDEMTEAEAIKLGYISRTTVYVNPIKQLRENGKLTLTDEEILNLRYVPYPRNTKNEWELTAATVEKNGFFMPVVLCQVQMKDLLADMNHQLVINKIAELEQAHRFTGWKFGDLENSIVDGNFE